MKKASVVTMAARLRQKKWRSIMGKSILIVVAALLVVVVPVTGGAQTIIYDTHLASITCNTLIGTVSPKPALAETPQPGTVLKIKGKLGGCTVDGAVPADLQVLSGTLSAKLAVTTPGGASCAGLVGALSVTGNIVFKWKTAKGQTLDFSTTTFTPDASGLAGVVIPIGTAAYGSFTVGGTLASGSAFGGASSPALFVLSAEDIVNMMGQCCTSCSPAGAGIKLLHFGIGQVTM